MPPLNPAVADLAPSDPAQPTEPNYLLATLPPTAGQRRLAYIIAIILLLVFVLAALFKDIQLPRVDAFIPSLQTAILFNDLITAALLYSQFIIVGYLALLILAGGYLFSALMVIPYTLTFPGVFAPTGLLGAGLQSTAWLYFFWHIGLPLSVIAYALLKGIDQGVSLRRRANAAVLSIPIVIAMVIGVALLCTVGDFLLPKIMLDSVRVNLNVRTWYGGVLQLVSIIALVILFLRRRSVLGLWLSVMSFAWVLELLLGTTFVTARFSVGWYGSRIFALAAAVTVLIVLLSETTTLYAHLALSNARRREASKMRQIAIDTMAASIAHEIRQPLAAMMLNTETATEMLSSPAPDIEEVKSALIDVAQGGHRIRDVIDGIRNMFDKERHGMVLLDPNDVVQDASRLIDTDLRMQEISSAVFLRSNLPKVRADRGQLRQVMLNLILNAAEAMHDITNRPRLLRIDTDVTHDNSDVVITVEDNGTGVDGKNIDRIFEPFFTTKSTGTGVGLAVCRSIVEAHGGQLTASPNIPFGTIFRVALPQAL
jgi:signal transduction histidine kinase